MAVFNMNMGIDTLREYASGRSSLLVVPETHFLGVQFESSHDRIGLIASEDADNDDIRRGAIFLIYNVVISDLHAVIDLEYSMMVGGENKVMPAEYHLGRSVDDFKESWDKTHGGGDSAWDKNPNVYFMIVRRKASIENTESYVRTADPLKPVDAFSMTCEVVSTHVAEVGDTVGKEES